MRLLICCFDIQENKLTKQNKEETCSSDMRGSVDLVREVTAKIWRESKMPGRGGSCASDGVLSSIILQITVISTQASGSGQMSNVLSRELHDLLCH